MQGIREGLEVGKIVIIISKNKNIYKNFREQPFSKIFYIPLENLSRSGQQLSAWSTSEGSHFWWQDTFLWHRSRFILCIGWVMCFFYQFQDGDDSAHPSPCIEEWMRLTENLSPKLSSSNYPYMGRGRGQGWPALNGWTSSCPSFGKLCTWTNIAHKTC